MKGESRTSTLSLGLCSSLCIISLLHVYCLVNNWALPMSTKKGRLKFR